MRKSVGGTLRQAGEHLGIQIPILRFVLRTEDIALGGPLKTFLQLFGINASEKLFERGAGGGQRCGVLSLELTEVLAYRLDRSGTGRQGGQQTDQSLIDTLGEVQRRFRAVIGGGRN